MRRPVSKGLWLSAVVLGALSCGCAGVDYASSGPRMLPGVDMPTCGAVYPHEMPEAATEQASLSASSPSGQERRPAGGRAWRGPGGAGKDDWHSRR